MAKKIVRKRTNKLERWEIALVKKMMATLELNDQDILAYFTRPTRSINHARIAEIRNNAKHQSVSPASQNKLDEYLEAWPEIDSVTGKHIRDDELLLKAREAMICAVQCYNNPRALFKSENFIVLAIIANTYLLHWHYIKLGVDIRYKRQVNGETTIVKTKHGAEKHWELDACLADSNCPFDDATKENLKFLISIRHEIEHQLTTRIDDSISAKLQACALNFNNSIKLLSGASRGLDNELGLAIQFTTIDRDQRNILLAEKDIPANLVAAVVEFEENLSDEIIENPSYAYRVAYIEQNVNSRGKADQVVEFVRNGTERGETIRVALKETEKPKYKPGQVVSLMKEEGFPRFTQYKHTLLWKAADAKNPQNQFGIKLNDGAWYWYTTWVEKVRELIAENPNDYN